MVVWTREVLLVVVEMLLGVGEIDGFENCIQEVNGQIWCQFGYKLQRKGGYVDSFQSPLLATQMDHGTTLSDSEHRKRTRIKGECCVLFLDPLIVLLLSHFSRVRLCVIPQTAATRLPRPWDSPGKNTGVGCHFLLQCMKVKSESQVVQSCPTLRDLMYCSLPGSSIHGIFQAKYWSGVPLPSPHINITFCLYQVKNFCCKLRNSLFPV